MIGFGMGMMRGGFPMIIWVLIIVGVIYFFTIRNNQSNNSNNGGNHQQEENRAVEIAKERYAKGEISKEELDELLKNLR